MLITSIPIFIIALLSSLVCTPKRNYRNVESSEIDKTIEGLSENEIQSFKSGNIEVSVQRKNNRILIEPYLPRVKEAFFRAVSLVLSFYLLIILLVPIASVLELFKLYAESDIVIYSAGKFWYVYMIVSFAISRQIRLKLINKNLQRRNQKQWDVFNQTYSEYEYKTKND